MDILVRNTSTSGLDMSLQADSSNLFKLFDFTLTIESSSTLIDQVELFRDAGMTDTQIETVVAPFNGSDTY